MVYIFIFPKTKQIKYLTINKSPTDKYFIICKEKRENVSNNGIVFLEPTEKIFLTKTAIVVPCSEEGIYWLKNNYGDNMILRFSQTCLELLDKKLFKKYISKNGVVCPQLYRCEALDYPIIAKPSFGFGSIGVKKIDGETERDKYLESFNDIIQSTEIKKFKDCYFKDMNDEVIFEEYIEGDFFSIPFYVSNGVCKKAYLVEGNKTRDNKWTDFMWTEFCIKAEQQSGYKYNLCLEVLNKLVDLFKLQCGVFMAEVIVNNAECILLEFSPRQPGGKISELVYSSMGIDLDILALDVVMSKLSKYDSDSIEERRMLIYVKQESEVKRNDMQGQNVYGEYVNYIIQ